jgi:hypothetical protein
MVVTASIIRVIAIFALQNVGLYGATTQKTAIFLGFEKDCICGSPDFSQTEFRNNFEMKVD